MQVVLVSPLHYQMFYVANYIFLILHATLFLSILLCRLLFLFIVILHQPFKHIFFSFSIKSTFIVNSISHEGSFTFALYRFSLFPSFIFAIYSIISVLNNHIILTTHASFLFTPNSRDRSHASSALSIILTYCLLSL